MPHDFGITLFHVCRGFSFVLPHGNAKKLLKPNELTSLGIGVNCLTNELFYHAVVERILGGRAFMEYT